MTPPSDADVAAMRAFTRFYTRLTGVLQEGLLDSPFSLAEVRVLYEIANRPSPTAAEIGSALGLDEGYLSRILRALDRRSLISRERSSSDARQRHISLSVSGRRAFSQLNTRSNDEVRALLARLDEDGRMKLIAAMRSVLRLLDDGTANGMRAEREAQTAYTLRPHRPGDMGWIVHRHGALYAREYAFDERFEALVAKVVADFIEEFDPKRERCWIAEREGEIVGSIFLKRKNNTVAKLRLLYVEPSTRGMGIGRHLVKECIAFARSIGYRKITLWTNSILDSARRIYEEEGFQLLSEEAHHMFGPELIGQTWELVL
jgi:DNA-binding MarR family transcriptional regulator/GNAT superfamily N-acetyltransferase